MRTRTLAIAVLCTGLVLAGCSGGSGEKDSGEPTAKARAKAKATAAPPELPAGYRKIGGAENGFTAGVPKSWRPLNLNATAQTRGALEKSGMTAAAAKQAIASLKKNHAVLVFDPRSAQKAHFAANLNGFCQKAMAPSAGQVKAQLQQIGAQQIRSQKVTIGGRSGLKTTYERRVGTVPTVGTQYQVTGDSEVCFVTMTEKRGTKAPFTAIGATIYVL